MRGEPWRRKYCKFFQPPGWLAPGANGRIGCDSGDLIRLEQAVSRGGEPRGMARFADDGAVMLRSELLEEACHHSSVKGVGWRELHEQWTAFETQPTCLVEKTLQLDPRPAQLQLVRNGPGHFDGEEEVCRGGIRPLLVGRERVRAIERRVDLDRVQLPRIPLQVRACPWGTSRQRPRNAPAGGADTNHASPRECEGSAAAVAGESRRALSFAKGGRIVDATIRALPGRIGIDDVAVGATVCALDLPIRRPRVLRPQHLGAASGAWFGTD